MKDLADKIKSEINSLTDIEKLHIVDIILTDLDKTDPVIDRIWADESRKRWAAYKSGSTHAVPYDKVMEKHRKI